MGEYSVNRVNYSDRSWKQKGQELLDAVQDADTELKIANRNTKFLVACVPFCASAVLFPAIYTFFTLNVLVILVMIVGIILLCGNLIALTENLISTGKIGYNNSLAHNLEKARRRYYEWVEINAEPKPEPKVVSTQLIPKVTTRKIHDNMIKIKDFPILIDRYGNIIEVLNFPDD